MSCGQISHDICISLGLSFSINQSIVYLPFSFLTDYTSVIDFKCHRFAAKTFSWFENQPVRLSNIECKAWLIEILTNTYFAFLFCDRAPSAEIDSYLKIPLNLRDCVPGQGQLLQIVKARLSLAKRREWNGVFRQAGACGEERKDELKSACGGRLHVTWLMQFSCAWNWFPVFHAWHLLLVPLLCTSHMFFALHFDWFILLFAFVVIGQTWSISLDWVLKRSLENRFWQTHRICWESSEHDWC